MIEARALHGAAHYVPTVHLEDAEPEAISEALMKAAGPDQPVLVPFS